MTTNLIHSPADGPRMRWLHLALGLFAGAAYWGVFEWAWGIAPDRLSVFALMFVLVGFGVAGILLAELGLRRAIAVGALMGVVIGGLVALGVGNFDTARAYFRTDHVIIAITGLATLPVPFALGWLRDGRSFSYRHLFMDSWTIVVRYGAAWAFAGLAVGVVFASSSLLALVGIEFLRDLLREEFVIAVLLGGLVGLGLAVIAELNDLISPYLLLRLVRLVTPFVLVVLAVFLAMIPVRGLTELFDGLSSGGSLMAAGIGAVALISIVVDRGDLDGPSTGVLYWSARLMSGLVVVFGGLAAAAVWLRVAQYGWTPERVSAAAVALVVLGYGIAYGLALLRGVQWRAGVRAGNWAMAVLSIGLGALWLNPWVTPESIAVRSQMARFDRQTEAGKLPLWEMAHDWGRFGTVAIAALKDNPGPVLAARLAALEAATAEYRFNEAESNTPDMRAYLADLIPVLPAGRVVASTVFGDFTGARNKAEWDAACAEITPQGHPGCLLVVADVLPWAEGDEVLILGAYSERLYWRRSSTELSVDYDWDLPDGMTTAAAIDAFWAEGVVLAPSSDKVFSIGGQQIAPRKK